MEFAFDHSKIEKATTKKVGKQVSNVQDRAHELMIQFGVQLTHLMNSGGTPDSLNRMLDEVEARMAGQQPTQAAQAPQAAQLGGGSTPDVDVSHESTTKLVLLVQFVADKLEMDPDMAVDQIVGTFMPRNAQQLDKLAYLQRLSASAKIVQADDEDYKLDSGGDLVLKGMYETAKASAEHWEELYGDLDGDLGQLSDADKKVAIANMQVVIDDVNNYVGAAARIKANTDWHDALVDIGKNKERAPGPKSLRTGHARIYPHKLEQKTRDTIAALTTPAAATP